MKTSIWAAIGFALGITLNLSALAGEMPQYTRTDYPLTERARFIHTGSENADTYPDVIVVGWNGALHVFPGSAAGSLGTPVLTDSGVRSPNTCVADDFTNDGLTDICINDTLFIALGDGRFASPKPLGIERLQTLASTDMNGDGKKDLIAIATIDTAPDMQAAELRTCFGNGDGTFREPVKTRIVFTSGEINWEPETGDIINDRGYYEIHYAGDLTGDGVPDLIVRHIDSPPGGPGELYTNCIYTGTSGGAFTRTPPYSGGNTQIVGVYDFNGDDAMDIMESFTYMAHLYYGNNMGRFDAVRQIRMDSPEIGLDNYSRIFAVNDINDNGIPDMVIIRLFEEPFNPNRYCTLAAIPLNRDGSFGDKHEFPVILPDNFLGYVGWRNPGVGGIMPCALNEDAYTDFLIPEDRTPAFLSVILSAPSPVRVDTGEEFPSAFLGRNSPNPFNASTVIPFLIGIPGYYELAVYDVLGRKIATLASGFRIKGKYRTIWDGKTTNGADAASGFYFYVLRRGKETISSNRLLLIR